MTNPANAASREARARRAQRVWNESCDAIGAMLAFAEEERALIDQPANQQWEAVDKELLLAANSAMRFAGSRNAITADQERRIMAALHALAVLHDTAPTEQARSCTCHPDDRPEGPCRQKYAASECATDQAQRGGEVERRFVIRRSGAFFRPAASGYTTHIVAAGFYSRAEADAYADVEGVTIHSVDEYRAEIESVFEGAQRARAALAQSGKGVE